MNLFNAKQALFLACMLLAVFALDLKTPRGYEIGPLYLLPFLLAYRWSNARSLLPFAVLCSGLIAIGHAVAPPGIDPVASATNRFLAIGGLWFTAVLLFQRQRETAMTAHLAAIVESSQDAIIGKTLDGVVTSWNRGAAQIFGYTEEEMTGQPITILYPPDQTHEEELLTARIRQGKRVEHFETVRKRKDGLLIPVSLTASPIKDASGTIIGVSTITRDITDRKEMETRLRFHAEELKQSYARLQELTRRLERTEEDERKRIAREIHDEFGQFLTCLKFDLAWLEKNAGSSDRRTSPDTVAEKLRAMSVLVDTAVQSVRKITASLRPSILDDLGLVEALKWLAQEYQAHANFRCQFRVGPSLERKSFAPTLSAMLFRIGQELLTNVMRHARAKNADMTLREEDRHLVLEIRDDGRGIEEQAAAKAASFGLRGLRERAALLGGTFTIKRNAGRGTTAVVRIPLKEASTEGG